MRFSPKFSRLFFSLFLILPCLALVHCGGDHNSPQAGPEIHIEKFSNEHCLNLEKLNDYVRKNFSFPARVVTQNFQSQNPSTLHLATLFGVHAQTLRALPFLRGVKQKDCDSILLTTSYGRPIAYKITEASPSSLVLDLAPDSEQPPAEDDATSSEAIRTAEKREPLMTSYRIVITSPLSLQYTINSSLLSPECGQDATVDYERTAIVRWGPKDSWPARETIDPDYFLKVLAVLGQAPPDEEVTPTGAWRPSEISTLETLQKALLEKVGRRTCERF